MKLIDDYEKKPIIIIPAYCPDEKLLNLIWEIREKVQFYFMEYLKLQERLQYI